MLLFFLSQILLAQTVLFDADCGALNPLHDGSAAMDTPYFDIQIRKGTGDHFMLSTVDAGGSRRSLPLFWENDHHVTRFSNGETWLVTRDAVGHLSVRVGDKLARCVSPIVARDPFDGSAYDPEHIWKVTRGIAGGCGSAVGDD